MKKWARGKQRAFVTDTHDGDDRTPCKSERPRERKAVYLWIPREYVKTEGVDVHGFVEDVNRKITERGFVTYDGQILRTPVTDITAGPGIVSAERQTPFQRIARVGEHTELILEGDDLHDPAPQRTWNAPMHALFGLPNPYQMCEDESTYTVSKLGTLIFEPYLLPGELIAALVHGAVDNYYLYCECHCADVVYTTRARLVCMGCGAMHLVLREAVSLTPKRLLSAEEWFQYFDGDGERRHDEIGFSVMDFREVESAETIWITDRWEAAKHQFVFFARSSSEEIEAVVRGTEADPSIFLEVGWKATELDPPPAEQIAENSVEVDLIENSAHAARDGVVCFLRAQTDPSQLVNAIPHLFRAIELLLKAKLEMLDADALAYHRNTPEVLDRLAARSVPITPVERDCIDRLRRLRNRLQHGSAKFNYRTGLSVARQSIIFIDRFVLQEADSWLGDAVAPEDRLKLFRIKEVAHNARTVVAGRLDEAKKLFGAEISTCPTCGEDAMVRRYPNTGAVCFYCGRPPLHPHGHGP